MESKKIYVLAVMLLILAVTLTTVQFVFDEVDFEAQTANRDSDIELINISKSYDIDATSSPEFITNFASNNIDEMVEWGNNVRKENTSFYYYLYEKDSTVETTISYWGSDPNNFTALNDTKYSDGSYKYIYDQVVDGVKTASGIGNYTHTDDGPAMFTFVMEKLKYLKEDFRYFKNMTEDLVYKMPGEVVVTEDWIIYNGFTDDFVLISINTDLVCIQEGWETNPYSDYILIRCSGKSADDRVDLPDVNGLKPLE